MTPSWHLTAPCRGRTALFFAPEHAGPAYYDAARTICRSCPYRIACLEEALEEEGDTRISLRHGVRGGLTPIQRGRLASARRLRGAA